MSLLRRVASKAQAARSSVLGAAPRRVLERAVTPVLEGLEDRRMLAVQTLSGSIRITGNGFNADGTPIVQNYTFRTNDDVMTRISVAGSARVEVLFAANPDPGGGTPTITYGLPLPADPADDPPLPKGDIFAMYVDQGNLNSFIAVSEINDDGDFTPFEGSHSFRVINRNGGNPPTRSFTTDDGTGQIFLGTKTLDTVPDTDNEQDRFVESAVLGDDFGDLNSGDDVIPGLRVASGVNLGRFLFGGTVTGLVDIGGAMELFYAGNLLTGSVQGESAFATSVADNFHVAGDLRMLAVTGSIGTVVAAEGNLTAPQFFSGFALDVDGKLGMVYAGGNLFGKGRISNNAGARISGSRLVQELEARGTFTGVDGNGLLLSIDKSWANGYIPTGVFYNDDFDHPQYVGDVNGQVHISGNLYAVAQGDGSQDYVDYYGIPLMAGQTIEYELDSDILLTGSLTGLNNNLLQVGVIDPDGRLIGTDLSDVDLINLGDQRFRFTADRPGVYRIVVATPTDADFNGSGGEFGIVNAGDTPYELHLYNVGSLGVGGIAADGNALDTDLGTSADLETGWQVDVGDFGAYRANDTMVSSAGSLLATLDVTNPQIMTASVRVLQGNLRSVSGGRIGMEGMPADSAVGSSVAIDVPNGSVGEVRSADELGINGTSISLVPTDDGGTPILTPYNVVGGSYQRIVTPGKFYGAIVANKGLGTLEAGNMFTLSPSVITVNADRTGNDGIIDAIDVRGDFGTLQGGGPWITTGPRGNVRYLNVEGTIYLDEFFGGGTPQGTTYPAGQGDRFRDDSGSTVEINPSGGGTLEVITYGIRGSGGVAIVRVSSTSGIALESLGRTGKGSAEIGKILTNVAVGGTGASAIPANVAIEGKKKVDVLYIQGGSFGNIVNDTKGELVTIRATAGGINQIDAESVGVARRSAAGGSILPGFVISNTFPFNGARTGVVATGDIDSIETRGALGNVTTSGDLNEVVVNADDKNTKKGFDGIVGAIHAAGDIGTVNIGRGIAPAGNGNGAAAGIFSGGTIDEVVGDDNADIRGTIAAITRINSIQLRGGSIINSNIGVFTELDDSREFDGDVTLSDDGDSINNPSYEIGEILVEGGSKSSGGRGGRTRGRSGRGGGGGKTNLAKGGIIGSSFAGSDIGTIRVSNGFGIINSTIGAQGNGRIDSIQADGYGIRDTFIIGNALLREIIVGGTGKQAKATDFSASVRGSEGKSYDKSFLFRHNRLTDLHRFLGTTKANPNNGDATRTGVIAGIDARGGRRLNEVTAYEIRGSFHEILGTPYFQSQFNFANEITEVTVKRHVGAVNFTTGQIDDFVVGRDLAGTRLTVAGTIENLRVGRDVGTSTRISAIGPDGDIENLFVGRNLKGRIVAEQDILQAQVKGTVSGTLSDKDGTVTPKK